MDACELPMFTRMASVPYVLTTRCWASRRLSPAAARLKRAHKRIYHRQYRRHNRICLRAFVARLSR